MEAMAGQERSDGGRLGLLVGDLVAYCKDHFLCEEEFMLFIGYPDFAAHSEWHRQCLEAVEECLDSLAGDPAATARRLTVYLRGWLTGHLAGADRQLGEYLSRQLGSEIKYGR
ncbi:MAG: hemerythrin family protein [Negativicutes bacterium]|nr:hemerythrin family protein [Negativicutes bacterium]